MSGADRAMDGREAEIWACLDHVTDPELDEPVTELRFVTGVTVSGDGGVSVAFRLPTYWCAANFAYLMADDMRRAVATLPWVTRVEVTLGEHMYAEAINDGLDRGASFQETFGAAADGNLDELRHTFLVKAFQRRQEALLRHLLSAGMGAAGVAALTLRALGELDLTEAGSRLRRRYAERRHICAPATQALAFVDANGAPLTPGELPAYLTSLSRVSTNAEFNGALCRGLLAARFDEDVEEPAIEAGSEPMLHDFIRRARREDIRLGRGS